MSVAPSWGQEPVSHQQLSEIAVGYTSRGWAVFPTVGKHPAIKGGAGLHDAAGDPDAVAELFARAPQADGVAVNCGASGLLVVDIDTPAGVAHWDTLAMPVTATATTGRGQHLYFQTLDPRARSSTGRVAAGIDTRGHGGYVLLPPSRHPDGHRYAWLLDGDVVPCPDKLLELLSPYTSVTREPVRTAQVAAGNTNYGLAALRAIGEDVLHAPEGQRNSTLNKAAFRVGQLVRDGHLETHSAQVLVDAALANGVPEREALNTFLSGFSAGMQ